MPAGYQNTTCDRSSCRAPKAAGTATLWCDACNDLRRHGYLLVSDTRDAAVIMLERVRVAVEGLERASSDVCRVLPPGHALIGDIGDALQTLKIVQRRTEQAVARVR
jgi:hypothetical protein